VTIPENVYVIHSMILDDWRISGNKIAKTLAITRERVGYIIHEILDMRRLSASVFSNVSMLAGSVIKCFLHKPF
jgi:predicted regulator of amino acid metabolism with ACT domain